MLGAKSHVFMIEVLQTLAFIHVRAVLTNHRMLSGKWTLRMNKLRWAPLSITQVGPIIVRREGDGIIEK